jgi:hypothetical protein
VSPYEEYLAGVIRYLAERPSQRSGQAHFNWLFLEYPDLADRIRGDFVLDPFHVDDKLPAFLAVVKLRLVAAS